jgi:hypothetical protein
MLVDADNCYNHIAHPMVPMVFQSFGVPTSTVESILTMIQNMKFYLRTGYGDSNGCADRGLMIHLETKGKHKECVKVMAQPLQLGLL